MDIKDPNFWTIVSILAAIAIMLITLYAQRNSKSLVYTLPTETQLLSVGDEIKGKLQIILDGVNIQNAHLILIKVWNNGNVSITRSDFDDVPLTFSFSKSVRILNVKVIEKKPKTLQPDLKLTSSNQFTIEPLLLNKQDRFTIKLLAAEYVGDINVHARINGVKDIKRVTNIFSSSKWQYPLLGLILATAVTSMAVWIYPEWLSEGLKSIVLLLVAVLVGVVGFIQNFRQAFDQK